MLETAPRGPECGGAGARSRKGWCPGALRPMLTGDGWLVRLRITGGMRASAARARHRCMRPRLRQRPDRPEQPCQSAASRREGRDARSADAALQHLGLLDDAPEAEVDPQRDRQSAGGARSAGRCSISGPLVALARTHGWPRMPRCTDCPAKFGFLLDDGGAPSLRPVPADVRFDARSPATTASCGSPSRSAGRTRMQARWGSAGRMTFRKRQRASRAPSCDCAGRTPMRRAACGPCWTALVRMR